MITLIYIGVSILIISLFSFSGIIFIGLEKNSFDKLISFFVSISIGTLMGGAFFHLIPESLESLESTYLPMGLVICGIFLFLLLEQMVRWRHCHDYDCPVHAFAYLNLIGDGLHNFIDGIAIASAYLIEPRLGVSTTIAILFHEIPQELGDFGVLIYGGFKKSKALIFNFISSLTALIGGIGTFYFSKIVKTFELYIPSIAAGGFLYIALSDLIPEFHRGKSKNFFLNLSLTIVGILTMILLRILSE
ncbi:MAG: ZIP family metal transporter [Candidatus Aminicenantia bacterium]